MIDLDPASWVAIGYGMALVLIAYGIDRLARRAQRALDGHRAGGFVYHEDHDAWLCPEDQWLWPQSFDPENRVMRYRGKPSICNACPVKDTCTSSDDGREMRRQVDSWPASESARFHRWIACSVTVIAVLWPALTALTVPDLAARGVLWGSAALLALFSLPLWSHLRRTPADPHGIYLVSEQTLEENLRQRALAASALERRRSGYASDRRQHERGA